MTTDIVLYTSFYKGHLDLARLFPAYSVSANEDPTSLSMNCMIIRDRVNTYPYAKVFRKKTRPAAT